MLIQHPGFQKKTHNSSRPCPQTGYGAGWDLIIPASWGMAFWLGLVYRGARVGGLRDLRSCDAEQRTQIFPDDFPDTSAGQNVQEALRLDLQTKYDKMPPAKRPNYSKFECNNPFQCSWDSIISSWIVNKNEMTAQDVSEITKKNRPICVKVIRVMKDLVSIANYCNSKNDISDDPTCLQYFSRVNLEHGSDLLPVSVECVKKGTPSSFSAIYIPHVTDLMILKKQPNYPGPLHICSGKATNRKANEITNDSTERDERVGSGNLTTTRKMIGYINNGNFSLTTGHGSGHGFVVVAGMIELLQSKLIGGRTIALIRSPDSLQYRYVYLDVIV